MKNWRFSVLLAVVPALSVVPADAQEITLYPHPDWSSRPIATVAPGDPRFRERGAVIDPVTAALGWQWGEFHGEFVGYVTEAKIGKDLYPVVGTLIHAYPDIDSHVLGTVTAEDLDSQNLEVIEEGPWWTVSFSKPIPVFFREAVVRAEPDVVETVDEDEPEQVALREEPPPPAIDRAPAPPPRLYDEDEVATERATSGSVGGSIGTTFRGTLRRTSSRLLVFSPPYGYELLDRNGKRIAYVDLGRAVLRQPASSYLGREVSVYGTWESAGSSRAIVIRARNLNELPAN